MPLPHHALEAMIAIVTEQLAAGGRVEIANFLTLDVQYRTRLDSEQTFWDNEGITSGQNILLHSSLSPR